MKVLSAVLVALAFGPALATGQSLTGSYVFQGPNGPVSLVLEQTAANQVVGRMDGVDGGVFQLQGEIDAAGRAIGSISINGSNAWFAAGIVNGQLLMAVAEIDPATGQPDMESGWSLTFDRVGGAGGQGGYGANPYADGQGDSGAGGRGVRAGGAGAEGGQGQMGVTENSAQVQQWRQHLSGKRVTYMDSYSSSDVGGFGGYSQRWDAYLCSNGTFYFQQSSSVSADVGGVFGGGAGGGGMQGTWRIVEQAGQVFLQYQMSDGTSDYGQLSFQNGSTYFAGNRVYVTNENPYCG